MGVTDTIMAGAVSATDLAAVAVGFSLWVPIIFSFIGIFQATTALVARAVGARDSGMLTTTVQQSIWLAMGLSLVGIALLLSAPLLMQMMAVAPSVRALTTLYLIGTAIGLPAALLFQVVRGLSEGSGFSKTIMVISVGGFLLNIPLNYLFIHGFALGEALHLPALGGAGCGFASGAIHWLNFLALGFLLRHQWRPHLRRFQPPHWLELRHLLWLGLPIGGALFMEVSIFAVVSLLIGHLGAAVLASHQIAMSITSVAFMVPSSLAVALTVKVGNALGAGQRTRARSIAWMGALTGIGFGCCTAMLMLIGGQQIVALYNDDPAVRELAVYLLVFAAAYQISDALQVTAAGSLRGYHDTRVTLLITILAYWGAGLPVGYVLGLTDWLLAPMGVAGFWVGFIVGLSAAALMLNWRLARLSARA